MQTIDTMALPAASGWRPARTGIGRHLEERGARQFASNAAADLLRSGRGSLRDVALFMIH